MSGTLQIALYGEINSWTVRDIVSQLQAAPGAEVTLKINSPGGDVTEGFALANVLRSHTGRKVAIVEGVCASAATFPLCACDVVQMHPESLLMVHSPWGITEGGAEEMESYAAVLDKMASLCVGLYQRKTGATEDQVREWIKAETWFSPQEALAAGFASEILTTGAPPAARASAARYVAMARKHKDKIKMAKATENDGIPDGGAIPENLRAKLAKHGMGEDPSHEEMMAAYDAYMEETDDGPDGRREMKRCMERMKMADMGDEPEAKMDDMDGDEEESSADKGKKMAAKLRQSANLDPAVAKLVDSLTGSNAKLAKRLDTYEAKERARAEESFYVSAEKYTTREDAADYLAKCGGNAEAAMALIKKLPQRSVFGRLFAGGSPVGGTSMSKDAPVEAKKTIRTGHNQTTTLHGLGLAAMAKKRAEGKDFHSLAAALVQVARERPDLYQ